MYCIAANSQQKSDCDAGVEQYTVVKRSNYCIKVYLRRWSRIRKAILVAVAVSLALVVVVMLMVTITLGVASAKTTANFS